MKKQYLTAARLGVMLLLAVGCLAPAVHGANIFVATNGNSTTPYDTWAKASTNIEWAVNVGVNGDLVWISNGVYVLTNQVTVVSNITIRGNPGERVVVDGNNANRCFYFTAASAGVLSNLVITRGRATTGNAGDGGGAYLNYGTVQDCIFSNNIATNGGAIYMGTGTILRCTFFGNQAYDNGGAILQNSGVIRGCLLRNNTAAAGGGYSISGNVSVANCTIVNNSATGQGGGINDLGGSPGNFENCIIYLNQAGSAAYSNIFLRYASFSNCAFAPPFSPAGTNGSSNNIALDPQFIDQENNNFRLRSYSPCLNAGVTQPWMAATNDLDGYPRVQGGVVDIGAYEFRSGMITVTPTAVTNFLMRGNRVAVPLTLVSTNYELYWHAAITSSWITAGVTDGYLAANAPDTVVFTNDATGLAGAYSAQLRFTATNFPNYGANTSAVTMVMNVISLSASPSNLANTVQAGFDATNQSFRVISGGIGAYDYAVTTNASAAWLIVSNGIGGLTNNATNVIVLTYATTNLASGLQTGVLDVATSYGGGQTQQVQVVLNVIALTLSPASLANTVLYGFDATSQTFAVSGGGEMHYAAASNAGWINVSPTGGLVAVGATNILTNTYTTAALAPGSYAGQAIVSSPDASGATGSVAVAMTVLALPVVGVSPEIRQVIDKGSNPTNDHFEVWNNSAAPVVPMAFAIVATNDPASILQGVAPAGGVSSGEQAVINISYKNVSTFAAGTYTAIVEVVATNSGSGYNGYWSGASNIAVKLVIAAPDSPAYVTASDGAYDSKVVVIWPAVLSPFGAAVTYSVLRHTTFDLNYAQTLVSGLTVTQHEDLTALPGVRYYYWVKCVNLNGQPGTNSVPDTGYRNLTAPSGLFASDGAYTNKVALNWAAVDGAGSYLVYRSNGGSDGIVYYTPGTEFEDSLVTEGVVYTYYVRATNPICGSALSAGESGYVLRRPTVLSASDGAYIGKVALTWDAVPGATAYEIWRSIQTLTPPLGGGAKIYETAAIAYDDTAVAAGTKYYYWLKSKNATALSAFSSREEGFPALAAVDLSVWGLVAQPRRIGPGGNPKTLSFRLRNNGGAALSGDNGAVRLTFYSSANPVFGDSDDQVLGALDQRLAMGIGASGIIRVAPANVSLPVAAGDYYLFMKLTPTWPSTLAPASAGGWTTRATNLLEVSSAGTINYQSRNDYDGDGISDLTVHGGGLWSARTIDAFTLAQGFAFGGGGVAVMGDYDGDRKTDPVVYDESRGYWQALLSGSGYTPVEGWFGGPGFRVVPGDYDGDGTTEAAVFDTARSLWYALKVGGGRVMWGLLFGNVNFEPVAGDYDGDGIWDLAIYDESRGLWYIRSVAGELILSGEQWGGPGFRPVSGDYNGDGLWDLALYDQASGRWYIETIYGALLANGVLWGAADYGPVSGDFNGDGLADLALYNPGNGKWFIRTVAGQWLLLDAAWGGGGQPAVGGVE